MGRQIVKNPQTNRYQIFSSITDSFILDDEFTREEMDEFVLSQFGQMGEGEKYLEIMKVLDEGGKPYGDLTMTWEEAKMWDTHQAEHGPKTRKPDMCKICKEIVDEENKK